jgi:hydrogenase maturation factor
VSTYPLGKLPAEDLAKLLNRYAPIDPRLIVGGTVGEDAAVIDMGDRYLVATTDPITFATDDIGWYAVRLAGSWQRCSCPKIKALPLW